MSHEQSYKAGEAQGRAEEKTGRVTDSMKETAREAKDKTSAGGQRAKEKTSETAEATREKAHEGKEKTKGMFQQTGEKVKHTAEGATDAVKHTLGMGAHQKPAGEDEDVGGPVYQQHTTTYKKEAK